MCLCTWWLRSFPLLWYFDNPSAVVVFDDWGVFHCYGTLIPLQLLLYSVLANLYSFSLLEEWGYNCIQQLLYFIRGTLLTIWLLAFVFSLPFVCLCIWWLRSFPLLWYFNNTSAVVVFDVCKFLQFLFFEVGYITVGLIYFIRICFCLRYFINPLCADVFDWNFFHCYGTLITLQLLLYSMFANFYILLFLEWFWNGGYNRIQPLLFFIRIYTYALIFYSYFLYMLHFINSLSAYVFDNCFHYYGTLITL